MFGHSIEIFRIFGVPIRLDWSWAFLFFLVAWSLAVGWFPLVLPEGYAARAHWLLGFLGAVGLFISILLHELAHALIARRNGVSMGGITLFLFGGVAEMTHEPPGPEAELRIAVAGPAVSGLLGLAFLGLSGFTTAEPLVSAVLAYLGLVNLVLLAFNLLPGFPLDGGRVLRAVLWLRERELREATRIASNVGSIVGLGLILLGALTLLGGGIVGGLWFILIGLFLRGAARTAYRQQLLHDMFKGRPIGRFVDPDTFSVGPEISARELVDRYVYGHRQDLVPVVSEERLVGCVSLDELGGIPPEDWSSRSAGQIMRPCPPETLVPSYRDAIDVLSEANGGRRDGHVMVVGPQGRFVGVVPFEKLFELFRLRLELEPPGPGGHRVAEPPLAVTPSDRHDPAIPGPDPLPAIRPPPVARGQARVRRAARETSKQSDRS